MTDAPNGLNAAVATAMAEVVRLKKADNNAFAKYRYTSVDDFKDALRPILASAGLSVSMNEVGCDMMEAKGEKAPVAKFSFAITLRHSSGENAEPERVTVMLPFVGAQTTGQARSYALKEWLKSRFLASSGDTAEDDPDYSSEELSKAAARPLFNDLQIELREALKGGKAKLEEWAALRASSISILPNDWRLMLRAQYSEGRATGKIKAAAAVEEQPSPAFEADARSLDEEYRSTVGPAVKPNFDKITEPAT